MGSLAWVCFVTYRASRRSDDLKRDQLFLPLDGLPLGDFLGGLLGHFLLGYLLGCFFLCHDLSPETRRTTRLPRTGPSCPELLVGCQRRPAAEAQRHATRTAGFDATRRPQKAGTCKRQPLCTHRGRSRGCLRSPRRPTGPPWVHHLWCCRTANSRCSCPGDDPSTRPASTCSNSKCD